MSRTNVYANVRTNRRDISVGGRGGIEWLEAWVNTDNAGGHDCGVTIRAEVVGHGINSQERRKKDGDQRRSVFDIELPDEKFGPEHCEVRINLKGESLKRLAQIGLVLCTLKGVQEVDTGEEKRGKLTLAKVSELAEEMGEEDNKRQVPHVVLPGGVTLVYALQCVEMVNRIREQHKESRGKN